MRLAQVLAAALALFAFARAQGENPNAGSLQYTSGELVGRDTVLHGALEASVKAASGPGLITAVLMIVPGAGESVGWQELAFEFFGKENGKIQTQVIVPGSPEEDPTAGHLPRKQIPIETNIGDTFNDYHVVRIEWGADKLRWLVDGKAIREESTSDPTYAKFSAGQVEPMNIRISLWAGFSDWSGQVNSSKVPSSAHLKYIQLEKEGGEVVFRDEFEFLDQKRWELADWSFPFSVSKFSPSNVQTKGGELVIAFTR